ncbi:MAG: hypothetical protein WDL87_07910 [Candidatus Omnitrophota bacterium]
MTRKWRKRAQTTAEYAILIALVIGAVVAMQIYVKRGIQGRIKETVDFVGTNGTVGNSNFSFTTNQYEPYYICSTSNSNQNMVENQNYQANGNVARNTTANSRVNRTQTMGW